MSEEEKKLIKEIENQITLVYLPANFGECSFSMNINLDNLKILLKVIYRLQKELENSISKDKIKKIQRKYKKKIEKLESKKIWNEPIDTINKNRYTNYFNALEDLLKENNNE